MQEFDRIKDMIYDELDEISNRGHLDKESVCLLGELADILKDFVTVEMFEEGINVPQDDYSLASGYSRNGGYSQRRYDDRWDRGNSYRGSRGGYNRRMRGYSRDDAKEHMIEKLEYLMNEANDEHDRQAIKNLIDQMEK